MKAGQVREKLGWEVAQPPALLPHPLLIPIFFMALQQPWSQFSGILGLKKKQQQNQLEKHCTTPNCCLLTVIKISTWLFQDGLLERHQDCCTHVMGLPGGPGGTGSMEVVHFHYSLSQHWARFVIACLSVFVYILPPSLDCAHSWRARTVSFFLPCGPAPSIKVSHNSLSTAWNVLKANLKARITFSPSASENKTLHWYNAQIDPAVKSTQLFQCTQRPSQRTPYK